MTDEEQLARLIPREREIYRLRTEGHSKRMIADELHISFHQVEEHLEAMRAKLGDDPYLPPSLTGWALGCDYRRPGADQATDASGAGQGRTVRFADGSTLEDVRVVVWATGYRSDYAWIHIPGVVTDGHVRHRRGVTDVPGLYFLGLSWQHTRGSALLGFVADDAAFLADRIAQRHAATAAQAGAAQQPAR